MTNSWHHLPDLYFLHIPKTAGTSIRTWLADLYPADALLPADHLHELEALSDDQIRACRLASGHFGWRFVERAEAVGKKIEVLTFLREPMAMRVSSLNYAASRDDDEIDLMPPEAATIARRARAQARRAMDTGYLDLSEIAAELPPPDETAGRRNIYVQNLMGYGFSDPAPIPPDDARADAAVHRLRTLAGLGVVEEMDWSIVLLCAALGLPYRAIPGQLNASEKKVRVSESYAEWSRRWNPYDDVLYNEALRLLEMRRAALCDELSLGGDAVPSDSAAALERRFLRTHRDIPLVREARVSMSDGLVCRGFAPALRYEPFGRWIRWAGLESTVYLPLYPHGGRKIRFEVAAVMNENIRDNLSLRVNGTDIALERSYEIWQDGAYHLVCEGFVAESVMDRTAQYTPLEFRVPETVPTDPALVEAMGPAASFALADIRIT